MAAISSGVRIPSDADKKVKVWLERISDGMKMRRREVDDWRRNEDRAYKRRGDYSHDTPDEITINKIGSWVEKRMAALSFRSPRVKMIPKRRDAWEAVPVPVFDKEGGPVMEMIPDPATGGQTPLLDPMTGQPAQRQATRLVSRYKILEATQNHIISHPNFDLAGEIRRFIRASLIGMGAAKVGYTADFEYIEDEIPPVPADQIAMMDPEYLFENYVYEDGVPLISNGMLVPKDQLPIEEQWFFQHVSYKRMIFDPDGENRFSDHNWVACEYDLPLDVVKKNKMYKNTANLKPTARRSKNDGEDDVDWDAGADEIARSRGRLEGDSSREIVKLIEIWDFVEKRWYVIADGHGKFLLNNEFPDGVDKTTGPWVFYRPTERIDEWYPDPPVSWLRVINDAYDKFNEQAMRDARKSARKVLIREELLDEFDKDQLTDAMDRVITVPKDEEGRPLNDYVMSVEVGGVNPSTLAMKQNLNVDFDEVGGSPGESRGLATANTATQTKALTAYDTLREDYQRGILHLAMIDAMRKLKSSIQSNITLNQSVTINGDDGMVLVTDVDYEMVQCDCDVDIDIADMAPLDENQMRANLERCMMIVAQAPYMIMDEEGALEFFSLYGIKAPAFIKSMVSGAQMQMQMQAAAAQPERPQGEPIRDEADAVSRQGRAQ